MNMDALSAHIDRQGFMIAGPVDANAGSSKRFTLKKCNGPDITRIVDIDPAYWNEHDPEYFIPIFNRAMDDLKEEVNNWYESH